MFFNIGVPKTFAIFTGKHLCWTNFIRKENPTTVFFYEYCETFQDTFYRTPPVVVFASIL